MEKLKPFLYLLVIFLIFAVLSNVVFRNFKKEISTSSAIKLKEIIMTELAHKISIDDDSTKMVEFAGFIQDYYKEKKNYLTRKGNILKNAEDGIRWDSIFMINQEISKLDTSLFYNLRQFLYEEEVLEVITLINELE